MLTSFDSAYTLWKHIEAHHDNLEKIQRISEDLASSTLVNKNRVASRTRPLGNCPSEVSDSNSNSAISIDELACAMMN